MAALDYSTLAIRNYHDAGNTANIRVVLAVLAVFSTGSDATNRRRPSRVSRQPDHRRRGRSNSTPRSPTFAMSSATRLTNHLPVKAKTMTTAAMVAYAYDQIDQARATLEGST